MVVHSFHHLTLIITDQQLRHRIYSITFRAFRAMDLELPGLMELIHEVDWHLLFMVSGYPFSSFTAASNVS